MSREIAGRRRNNELEQRNADAAVRSSAGSSSRNRKRALGGCDGRPHVCLARRRRSQAARWDWKGRGRRLVVVVVVGGRERDRRCGAVRYGFVGSGGWSACGRRMRAAAVLCLTKCCSGSQLRDGPTSGQGVAAGAGAGLGVGLGGVVK